MADSFINTRTSAPSAPDTSLRAREAQRTHAIAPRESHAPLSTVAAPAHTTSTVSPDILVAAQQAGNVDNVRTFDARKLYASTPKSEGNERVSDETAAEDRAEQSTAQGVGQSAEIIPLSGYAAFSSLPGSNERPLYEQPNDPSAPFSNLDLDRVARANQAYLSAGASDGQTFTGHGDTILNADQERVDILV